MADYLTGRERHIILSLIRAQAALTVQSLADDLEVSRRTILRDLKNVDAWFLSRQSSLSRKGSNGLFLDISSERRKALESDVESLNYDHVYSPKQRQTFIATELLQSKDIYKISVFAKLLDVSEATISHDLTHVSESLDSYALKLIRRPGYGIIIEGKESDKRRALMRYLYDELDANELRKVIRKYVAPISHAAKDERAYSTITQSLLDLIDVQTIQLIEESIKSAEESMGFQFVESSYTALAVHLALAVNRLQNGEAIDMPSDTLNNLKQFEEFSVAQYLIGVLKETLDLEIPDAEIGYITMHLKGARYHQGLYDENFLQFNELIISNYQLTAIINKMLNKAEVLTGYPIKQSKSLLIGLVDHIRLAINRIQMNLDIRNPLLNKIKETYPDTYQVAKNITQILETDLNIVMPDAEIGYIAMHLGASLESLKNKQDTIPRHFKIIVTCTSGIGTSNMLAERIRSEFDYINIEAILSTTQISEVWLLEKGIDLIISTVGFDNRLVPVVMVNPLLLEMDIQKIKAALSSVRMIKKTPDARDVPGLNKSTLEKLQYISQAAVELLDHLMIDDVTIDQFDQLLNYVTEKLNLDQVPANQLKKDILARESHGSLIFKEERVLFLHARSDTITHLQVFVIRHETMHYQEKVCQTSLVLLAPKKVHPYYVDVISEISRLTVAKPDFLNHLSTYEPMHLYHMIETNLAQYVMQKNQALLPPK